MHVLPPVLPPGRDCLRDLRAVLLRLTSAVAVALAVVVCGGGPTAQTPPGACTPAPGVVCFGQRNYIEYAAGSLPIVVSVPHGGALEPESIPNRTGTTVTDTNTIELGRAIAQAFTRRTGRAPHLVLCHLKRTKLDANREVGDAAQGNGEAARAWTEYHVFLELATRDVEQRTRSGLYVDLHGHGHEKDRLELGYLLPGSQLDLSDAALDAGGFAAKTSLRLAIRTSPARFSEILRGPTSLGGLLAGSTASVPSPGMPSPAGDLYFSGGYSTARHTARIAGLQIESHRVGVRDTPANRDAFADTFVTASLEFLRTHLGLQIQR
jgi:hypothetical protein